MANACTARGAHSPVHMVSDLATELCLALGQEKVADKSNEITAISALFAALDVKGCLVSLDAMGCQKEMAKTIAAREAGGQRESAQVASGVAGAQLDHPAE